ncbi:MAG TPA: low affinity iron permease family protein [Chitinophaga sp.]
MQIEKEPLKRAKGSRFEAFSSWVIYATGSSTAFVAAIAFIVVWALTGPLFHYSDTWQLIVNTSTTIITFLMVFLIQKSQNKDSRSIQLKLNELINATQMANNKLIGAEDLTEHELETMHRYYAMLAEQTRRRHAAKKAEGHRQEQPEA